MIPECSIMATSAINLYLSTVQEVFLIQIIVDHFQTSCFLHVGTLTSAPPFRICNRFCLEMAAGCEVLASTTMDIEAAVEAVPITPHNMQVELLTP